MRSLGTLGGDSGVDAIDNGAKWWAAATLGTATPEPTSGLRDIACETSARSAARTAMRSISTTPLRSSARADQQRSSHAFLWTPGRGMEDLGTLGGASSMAWASARTGPSSARARPPAAGRSRSCGPGARDAESRHSAWFAGMLCGSRRHPPAVVGAGFGDTHGSAVPVDAGRRDPTPCHARRRPERGRGTERVARQISGHDHQEERRTAVPPACGRRARGRGP